MTDKSDAKIEELSFEEALDILNETLEKLETGDLSLSEAIALYEYGMALAKQCNDRLDTAELRIKKLTPTGLVEPFADD
jgi:exodeoxyribonuclease VII small subunit